MNFQEGYARGGSATFYVDRGVAVLVVKYLLKQGALKEISAEARREMQLDKEAREQAK